MTSYVTPKKNAAFIFYLGLPSQATTGTFQSNPTLAAGDVKVSIDGGALNNLTTLPAVTPASSKMVKVSLSADEMNGDNITVVFSDAAGSEWYDVIVNIQTSARQIDDLAWPTTSGRSIDVTANGAVGIDWSNIENKTSTVDLTNTTIGADEMADAILAAFRLSGSAASAGASLASSDVDVFNQALDLLKESPITAFTDDRPVASWGTRNYVTSRNAELRENPWKFAIRRRVLYPTDYILEGITATLTGAWAPFRLTAKWSGDLATLRRSSDDTTDDFGIGTDDGDDPILLDTDAVSDFIGSGNGFFSQLFDQSGNGNHLAQATTTKQPQYVTEIGDNDRVAASFDGSNDILSTSVAMTSLMSVSTGYLVIAGLIDTLTLDSATKTSNHLLAGDASSKLGLYVRLGGTIYGINNDGSLDGAVEGAPTLVPFVAELRHDGGLIYVRINGVGEDSATSGDTSSLAGVLNIGDLTAGSQALDFKLFAAMTFSTIPTLAERDRIASRLMRFVATPGYKDFGWDHRYPLPSDCLRMLQIRKSGEFEGRLVSHEIEEGYILTDEPTSIYVRYISEFSDAAKFDPLFTEALAARLATKLAHWLTGKMGMVQTVGAAYNSAIERATKANAMEGSQERPADEDVIDQRYDVIGVR